MGWDTYDPLPDKPSFFSVVLTRLVMAACLVFGFILDFAA